MPIWYDGNRNLDANRREKDGITYYVRGLQEVSGNRYERAKTCCGKFIMGK